MTKRRWGRMAVLAAVVAGFVVPASVQAAVPPGTYSVSVSPATVRINQPGTHTVSFFNAGPPRSLDLMTRVMVKLAGFTNVTAPATVTSPVGVTWTVNVSGQTVTLSSPRGARPGAGVSVPISATAPATAGTYTWPTSASGRIGGAIGSAPFTLTGAPATKVVQPGSALRLAFVQQPSRVQVGNVMTPAVRVAVRDGFGNPVSYNGSVTLQTAFNPNKRDTANPPGLPRTEPVVNGVAVFDDLVIGAVGIGYRLRAVSGDLTQAVSTSFHVVDLLRSCPAQAECRGGPVGDPTNTTASIVDRAGANDDTFELTVGGLPPLDCSNANHGRPATFENADLTRVLEITMRLDRPFVQSTPGFQYMICFASKQVFATHDGTPATVGTDGLYYGLLPLCSEVDDVAPCVVSRQRLEDGDLQAVLLSTPGDPRSMFGFLSS